MPVNPPNWGNRTIFTGDNLNVLRRMNTGSVDLVYLDPPFNSNRNYSAPIGSLEAEAEFKDAWTLDDVKALDHEQLRAQNAALHDVILASRLAGGDSTMAYLMMMAARLVELHRVLKPTGSIYLHCDHAASHYLKLVMDCVFGRDNYRNEIVWAYTGPGSPKMRQFNRKHDTIHWYSMGDTWAFNKDDVRIGYEKSTVDRGKYDSNSPTTGPGFRDTSKGKIPESWWIDIPGGGQISRNELVGYPTQKPVKLLERIIKASSNKGDVVLDPFCGCATAAIAAEKLQRQWVGIDLSPLAFQLVKQRLGSQLDLPDLEPVERTPKTLGRDDWLEPLPPYKTHKPELYGKQAGNCAGCGVHFIDVNLTVDHIIPRSKGGNDHKSNLQLLCGNCNSRKGAKSMAELMVKLLNERGIG